MKSKNILYFIIIILSIFNSITIFNYKNLQNEHTTKKDFLFKINYEKLKMIITSMIVNENYHFERNQKIVNEKMDTLLFESLINKTKLIFYFNEYSCMPCINDIILLLKNNKTISKKDIIILSHYKNYRDMNMFAHINKLDIPIYNLTNQLKIQAVSMNIPFLFTISKDLTVRNLLIVDKSFINITQTYLNYIYQTLYQRKFYNSSLYLPMKAGFSNNSIIFDYENNFFF